MYLWEVVLYHLDATVDRVVVDDPYVQFQFTTVSKLSVRPEDRRQALFEEVLDVIVYYDDGEPHYQLSTTNLFLFGFLLAGVVDNLQRFVERKLQRIDILGQAEVLATECEVGAKAAVVGNYGLAFMHANLMGE